MLVNILVELEIAEDDWLKPEAPKPARATEAMRAAALEAVVNALNSAADCGFSNALEYETAIEVKGVKLLTT